MTVKTLLSVANDYEYISVEDEYYEVFAEGEAQDVARSTAIKGLKVACFYTGVRNNVPCTVVIVQ